MRPSKLTRLSGPTPECFKSVLGSQEQLQQVVFKSHRCEDNKEEDKQDVTAAKWMRAVLAELNWIGGKE